MDQKAYLTIIFNVLLMLKDFSRSQTVTCAVKCIIFWQNMMNFTMTFGNGARQWPLCYRTLTLNHAISDDLEWPSRSFFYYKPFQMQFFYNCAAPDCLHWRMIWLFCKSFLTQLNIKPNLQFTDSLLCSSQNIFKKNNHIKYTATC